MVDGWSVCCDRGVSLPPPPGAGELGGHTVTAEIAP